jgi:Transmembrane secretion effector
VNVGSREPKPRRVRGQKRGRKPLGRAFTQLWTASTVSSVGDGVQNVALPLLAASLTRDPLAVAAVTSAEFLPWFC